MTKSDIFKISDEKKENVNGMALLATSVTVAQPPYFR